MDGTVHQSREEKAERLALIFFPPAPEVDLNDVGNYEYSEAAEVLPINEDEVKATITRCQTRDRSWPRWDPQSNSSISGGNPGSHTDLPIQLQFV